MRVLSGPLLGSANDPLVIPKKNATKIVVNDQIAKNGDGKVRSDLH